MSLSQSWDCGLGRHMRGRPVHHCTECRNSTLTFETSAHWWLSWWGPAWCSAFAASSAVGWSSQDPCYPKAGAFLETLDELVN